MIFWDIRKFKQNFLTILFIDILIYEKIKDNVLILWGDEWIIEDSFYNLLNLNILKQSYWLL